MSADAIADFFGDDIGHKTTPLLFIFPRLFYDY
jgi:hypothetical protein